MPKLLLKGGLEANLPVLSEREPAITTDTKRVFVGSSTGNVELAKKEDLDAHTVTLGTKANQSDLVITNANVASNTSSLAESMKKIGNQIAYKTVSVTLGGPSAPDLNSYDAIFQRLAFQGIGCVLITLHATSDGTSTGNTFLHQSQTNIQSVIDKAKQYNVPIYMMKPHVVTISGGVWNDGFSRGGYLPSNPSLSFTNWETELQYIAGICNTNNIPYLCLTCEQPNQTDQQYYSTWQGITSRLKSNYPNLKLTSAFTFAEGLNNVSFAKNGQSCLVSLLDAYGHNLYISYTYKSYAVTNGVPNITLDEVCKSLYNDMVGNDTMGLLDDLTKYYNKPLFITETGIMNKVDGLIAVLATGATSYDTQALHFKAIFEVVCRRTEIIGFSIWHVGSPFRYYDITGATVTSAEQVLLDYVKGGKL